MFNKNLVISSAMLALSLALPVFAKTNLPSSAVIACVGAAVNVREIALGSGIAAHGQSVQAAYSTRAATLQQAYAIGDAAQVRSAIKTAWTTFNSGMRLATKAWGIARNDAWSQFRTALRACKAPASVTDSGKSTSEANGR